MRLSLKGFATLDVFNASNSGAGIKADSFRDLLFFNLNFEFKGGVIDPFENFLEAGDSNPGSLLLKLFSTLGLLFGCGAVEESLVKLSPLFVLENPTDGIELTLDPLPMDPTVFPLSAFVRGYGRSDRFKSLESSCNETKDQHDIFSAVSIQRR